jgi:hypothetical protein
MAADCKSAAPRSYGGSNPPLCTSIYAPQAHTGLAVTEQVEVAGITGTKKLLVAFAIYAALAALAWTTLSEPKFRYATMAILALFALRTWSWSKKQDREDRDENRD